MIFYAGWRICWQAAIIDWQTEKDLGVLELTFRELLSVNIPLTLAVAGWAIAQVLKVFVVLIQKHRFELGVVLSGGGMPSSHSATVCALAASIGTLYGVRSPLFALAAVFAFVVMYDAFNVRRATGEQAKILNYMMSHWMLMSPELFRKELKELIGHTPVQVFAGGALGILIGIFGTRFLV